MPENSILSPVSLTSYFDNATGEARQANLFFYKAGTLDPITAYTDSALHIPYPQPVATTGWGRVPPVYIGEIPAPGYRVRTFDQYQTLIEDLDGLPGALPTITSSEPITVDQTGIAKTGDVKLKWAKTGFTETGWVEITKGGTIGDIGSNASLMQSGDCHALFLHLWQQDAVANADVTLKVIPYKGASAEGDWLDGRQIEVPDARGRFLAGLDSEVLPATTPRSSSTGRLDKGLFADLPNTAGTKMFPWNLGAFGGEAVHKLTPTELAVHLHDWIDGIGHTHLVVDPGHTHTVTALPHFHPVTTNWANTDLVMGRAGAGVGAGGYSGGPGQAPTNWDQADLTTGNITVTVSAATNVTGVTLRNSAAPGMPGNGAINQWIGTFSAGPQTTPPTYGALDNQFHNKTENYPIPNDGSDGANMGDRPHNTTPPFILFAIYMKL